jgi:hypothetical protein
MGQAGIQGNAINPGAHGSLSTERAQILPDADKDILHQILSCIRIPGVHAAKPVHPVSIFVKYLIKEIFIISHFLKLKWFKFVFLLL